MLGAASPYTVTKMDDLKKLKDGLKDPVIVLASFVRRLTKRQQMLLLGSGLVLSLFFVFLLSRAIAELLFVVAELVHLGGIGILLLKLRAKKTASGISLRSQELTLVFLSVRFYCSLMMEKDIHTLLDLLTLFATISAILYIRKNLMNSYSKNDDSLKLIYLLGPCALLALIIHPAGSHLWFNRVCWAFAVYVESVSILPQLKMMQNMRVISELFAAHYVFALGCSRGLSFLHWVFEFMTNGVAVYVSMGRGFWPLLVILSEIVQTAIYADFCYYYLKSLLSGDTVIKLPV